VGGYLPLSGARGGDRFALALISLALDEVDATEVLRRHPRFGGIIVSVAARPRLRVSACPRERRRRPRRRRSSAVSPIPVDPG